MTLKKITTAVSLAVAALLGTTPAHAQFSGNAIKIGIITDMSGVYADIDGPAGVEQVRRAVKDFGGTLDGRKIEVVYADHQNKADIAASKAREWFDTQGVDMLIGGTTSSTSLSMSEVAKDKKKVFIAIGSATSALTNELCNAYTLHWAYDTVALAKGTGGAVVKAGGKTWFFITADYAFGAALQADTSKVIEAAGGTVVGSVKHPLSASDFSSYLLQAQNSGAQILGMANAGGDTINTIKQANEFGITKKMKLAGLLMFITDIHALGLKTTQGMYLTDSWYWNRDPETRAWSRTFFDEFRRMPTSIHAADYSATLQYLRAVKAAGSDDADKVLAQLRKTRINDVFAKDAYIRGDGTMLHDMYLMQVKSPAESTEPWDYYKVTQVIKGEDAFTSKADSKCALWK